jgi:hypothetical protein
MSDLAIAVRELLAHPCRCLVNLSQVLQQAKCGTKLPVQRISVVSHHVEATASRLSIRTKGRYDYATSWFDGAPYLTHVWTSHATVDTPAPHAEARSNASGLTPSRWLWRRVRL